MGTEKRDRQKAGRLARAEAELTAARRARRRRSALRVVIGVAVVLVVALGWSLLSGDDSGDSTETADDAATDDTTTDTSVPGTTSTTYTNPALAEEVLGREPPDPAPPPADTPPDALETEVLIEGQGEGAAVGDTVVVHYIGKVPDGTVFDQSWERGEPFTLALGRGMVIQGWEEGLVGAEVGERRRLVIGSEKAYGAEGGGDMIPPDTPLAFEVDIVDIQPAEADPTATTGAPTDTAPTETTAPAG